MRGSQSERVATTSREVERILLPRRDPIVKTTRNAAICGGSAQQQ